MRPASAPLDVFEVPLAGLNLIEAGAGTGKTWTLTGLYLRLLLSGAHRVEDILVVTYTNAATAELRDRIRTRLVEARQAFMRGASADAFLGRLLTAHADRVGAERQLTRALRSFDEAAIFTIHGFCQRVLADSAFESAAAFETELIADEREILQEVVCDFWRRAFYEASPALVAHALDAGLTPETLQDWVRGYLGKPYLEVRTPAPPQDLDTLQQALGAAYRAVRAGWGAERTAITDRLLNASGLNGRTYKKDSMPKWFAELDDYLRPEAARAPTFEALTKLTAATLAASVNKGKTPPVHPFFDACGTLQEASAALAGACDRRLRALRAELLTYCQAELDRRKRQRRLQCFDDLLLNLARALAGRGGAALAHAIRSRYSAALIDEFQDTDPVQYGIFREVYREAQRPLFFVGDPKQAIYSFRGADLFAYLKARADAGHRYALRTNWRSAPALIEAVNAVFARASAPFLFGEIPFEPAQAADGERAPLTVSGDAPAPCMLWYLARGADGKPVNKGEASARAARATAAEIARLLNLAARGEAHLGARPLEGGDIAVLVRSHRQGRLVREALLALGVPSVQGGDDNVFAAPEAEALERLLSALAEPGREAAVRVALLTDLLGVSGEALHRLTEDETAWEARLAAFQDDHRLWRERGFIVMLRTLMRREGVAARLLAYRDGERRLTNLLHLAELCQNEASRAGLGVDGLLKWFCERRQGHEAADEEAQLRLESDEHLVKIVTLHKSKGLEYPIVFCPFLWDGRLWANDGNAVSVRCHDPGADDAAVLDLGTEQQERLQAQARREELAENLRLTYVALTRAKERLYLVWGAIKEAGTSALAWLLHPPAAGAVDPAEDPIDAMSKRVSALDDTGLRQDLAQVAARAGGALAVRPLPDADGEPYAPPAPENETLSARALRRPIPPGWRLTSFTALTAGRSPELPDHDADSAGGPSLASTALDILHFPRGRQAGQCLHALFERLDFTAASRAAIEALAEETLRGFGFEPRWVAAVSDMVERVLAVPLDTGLCLSEVPAERRLTELEFHYPVARLDPGGLHRLLKAHGYTLSGLPPEAPDGPSRPGTPQAITGFMKGFIDLVVEAAGRYYLLDYKSHWLGPARTDYRPERLAPVMAEEAYPLQYLLYTVALHRYLRRRLPGYRYQTHFGGVCYLFLRGIDPALDPALGVCRDTPAAALIEALDRALASGAPDGRPHA